MTVLRCAIYTRKSSEEGLEQGFNSLHAQREACAAYVLSQAGEGWVPIQTIYDDGGFSGGSMNRPGLKALIADIDRGLIDVVVVYKVDRLTRSLADFARIVELFDKTGVSFVSITQAFNTTTSMGRLTLNVLLSFAQFEREVTGERIRDKIAASKKKGMWMGGRPPLGYDGVERKLVINEAEAKTVRHIFTRYLELGSVIPLERELAAAGVESKRWIGRNGTTLGGGVLGRGALYHMLANPVYRGGIQHRELLYPNSHPAIIDETLWEAVTAKLDGNDGGKPDSPKVGAEVLLHRILIDPRGVPMALTHAGKGERRYRYYIARDVARGKVAGATRLSRIAVGVLDDLVMSETVQRLKPDWRVSDDAKSRVQSSLIQVQATEEAIILHLRHEAASAQVRHLAGRTELRQDWVEVTIPVVLKHRHNATIIESANGSSTDGRIDRPLVRAVALARSWADRLASGEVSSISALADAEGYCSRYAARLLPLAWLAPDLIEAILNGRQPRGVSLGVLTRAELPMAWPDQRALFKRCGRSAN
jgi:DNA invertase Pin-like site-specific DNA recombinase